MVAPGVALGTAMPAGMTTRRAPAGPPARYCDQGWRRHHVQLPVDLLAWTMRAKWRFWPLGPTSRVLAVTEVENVWAFSHRCFGIFRATEVGGENNCHNDECVRPCRSRQGQNRT